MHAVQWLRMPRKCSRVWGLRIAESKKVIFLLCARTGFVFLGDSLLHPPLGTFLPDCTIDPQQGFSLSAHCTLRKFTHYLGFLISPKITFWRPSDEENPRQLEYPGLAPCRWAGCDISNPSNLRNISFLQLLFCWSGWVNVLVVCCQCW